MEKALFPLKYMAETQGVNGTYSHKGTFAIDYGHRGYKEKVYAPFTGIIKKISPNNGNAVYLESVDKVLWADGTVDHMCALFMHDDDISILSVGQIIKQGEYFYDQGSAGYATGVHLHLEIGKGKFRGDGWHYNKEGTFMINDGVHPCKALYISEDVEIKKDGGYSWIKIFGTPVSRNNDVNQIEVKTDNLRCRITPGGAVLGYINRGIYNILEIVDQEDYKWIKVSDNRWIAHNDEWSSLYLKKESVDVEQLLLEIDELKKEIENLKQHKFEYHCKADGKYVLKLYKGEIMYIK